MEIVSIALPGSIKDYVEERASEGGYESVSDYVLELIRSDLKRREVDRIDAMLLEGLNSIERIEVGPEFWEERHRRLAERLGEVEPR